MPEVRSLARDSVQHSPVLDALPKECAAALRERIELRHYRPHETVCLEGDVIAGPAWTHWGVMRVYQTSPEGREVTYLVVWPADVATPTLSGYAEWPLSATAITPVTTATIPALVFEEVSRRDHRLVTALLHLCAEQNHQRHQWLARTTSLPLRQRLPLILRRMANDLGTATGSGVLLDFRITRDDLAIIAGGSRDEVGRALGELIQAGVVERTPGRQLLIPDPERLDV